MGYNYFGLKGLKDFRDKISLCPVCDDVYQDDEMYHLIQLVYAPDPRTGLASSELSVLVSDSVNPQVADWVRKQILQPVPFAPTSIKDGKQVDDDTLLALTRESNESREMYVSRVENLLRSWNSNNEGD